MAWGAEWVATAHRLVGRKKQAQGALENALRTTTKKRGKKPRSADGLLGEPRHTLRLEIAVDSPWRKLHQMIPNHIEDFDSKKTLEQK